MSEVAVIILMICSKIIFYFDSLILYFYVIQSLIELKNDRFHDFQIISTLSI